MVFPGAPDAPPLLVRRMPPPSSSPHTQTVPHLNCRGSPVAQKVRGVHTGLDDAAHLVALIQRLAHHLAAQRASATHDQDAVLGNGCAGSIAMKTYAPGAHDCD